MGNYVFVGIGAYIGLSVLFFCFPQIMCKKPQVPSLEIDEALNSPSNKVMIIAHRGGAQEALENTMEAFKNAQSKRAHMIELDVQLTKDKVVVVSHDDDLERLTGVKDRVSNLNYDQLPPFLPEVPIHFSVENFHNDNPNAKFARLDRFPTMLFHIDLKQGTEELMHLVNDLVVKHRREHLTVWGAMGGSRTAQLKALNPRVLTFFPAQAFILVYLTYIIGLLPFIPLKYDVFSCPRYTRDFERMRNSGKRKLGCLARFFDWICRPLYWHLQRRGIPIFVWVLNDPKDFHEAVEKKVNGIMTDCPTALYDFLEEENKYLNVVNQKNDIMLKV